MKKTLARHIARSVADHSKLRLHDKPP